MGAGAASGSRPRRPHGRPGHRRRGPAQAGPGDLDDVEGAALAQGRLDPVRVRVDVALAAQVLDRGHHGVGDVAQDVAVVAGAGVAGEVERLAERHHGAPPARAGVPQPDRDHRDPGAEGEPGDPGPALEEPAVRRARALGEDADDLALAQRVEDDVHARGARTTARPVQRQDADRRARTSPRPTRPDRGRRTARPWPGRSSAAAASPGRRGCPSRRGGCRRRARRRRRAPARRRRPAGAGGRWISGLKSPRLNSVK